MNRDRCWLVGLLVLAAILAHDVLMASVGDDARVHAAAHRDAAPYHDGTLTINVVARALDRVTETPHPSGCTVVRSAAPPRDDGSGTVAVLPLHAGYPAGRWPRWSSAPISPLVTHPVCGGRCSRSTESRLTGAFHGPGGTGRRAGPGVRRLITVMARTTTWRPVLVAFAVVVVLTLVATEVGRASTPTPNHDAHHAGTPTADGVCDLAATPARGHPGAAGVAGMGIATPGMGLAGGTPNTGMMGKFDLMFIDLMITHHESAVAMARVALTRASHDVALPAIRAETLTLAQDIIASQSAEIAQMRAWRQAGYPDAPLIPMDQMMETMGEMMQGMPRTEGVDMMAMDPASEVAALCAAPALFDLALINAMIPHHRIAIAEVSRQRAVHPEIAELAEAIIDAQQREIRQMGSWRATWYGGTPAAG